MQKYVDELIEKKPNLLLFSIMSPTWPIARVLAKIAKEKINTYILCGGYHPTLFPDEVINNEYVDAICLGEGDKAIQEFIKKYEEKSNYKDVNNIWIKAEGTIIKNEIGYLIENLDSLPFLTFL